MRRRVMRFGVAALSLTVPASGIASPRLDYALHCMGCHQADGSGMSGRVPSLVHSIGRFLWAPGGRAYLVRVPGSAQSAISDRRLAALLNWLLEEFADEPLPPDFRPYSESEVARARRHPLVDVSPMRAALLAAAARARGDVPGAGAPE